MSCFWVYVCKEEVFRLELVYLSESSIKRRNLIIFTVTLHHTSPLIHLKQQSLRLRMTY